MNRQTVWSLSRKIIHRSRRTALQLGRRLLPAQKKLLFVFGGRTQHWPGIAKELYKKEKVFRETIQHCDLLVRDIAGMTILQNFEQDDKDFFDEEANVVFTIGSIQIACFELWKTRGRAPGAMMGISLGEAAAVYAAGGLTLKDTIRVLSLMAHVHQLEKRDFSVLYLPVNINSVYALLKKCTVFTSPIYEYAENATLVFCRQDNVETLQNFLKEQNIVWKLPHKETSWPYHTALMKPHHKSLQQFITDINPAPLQYDYYSCTLGKLICKNAIIAPDFWLKLISAPVMAYSAFQQTSKHGYNLFVNMGPNLPMKMELGGAQKKQFIVLDTVHRNKSEEEVFKASLREVKRSKIKDRFATSENNSLADFKVRLNFLSENAKDNPYPYFRYLQKNGSVHFLPVYNAWIVLDYEDIDYVLKHPEYFSSNIYSGFDSYLLGSDPPSHTLVRALLQPLFSPQVFASLGEYTTHKSHELLELQRSKDSFDFIENFSLPLARAVIARFLGLSQPEEEALNACIEHHVYSLNYLDDLEQFFRKHIAYYQNSPADNVASLLASYIKEDRLSFDGAVSLMRMLWIAGMTTTSALLGNAVLMLANNPDVAQKVRKNEQLISKFIEECLRLETPESELKRITTQQVDLGGETLPAGSVVMLGFRAANRDPKYFENPDEIWLSRPLKRHLSFGGGYHFCLGAGLARLEAKHALKVILDCLPILNLQEGATPAYFPSEHFRGLTSLKICTA